MDEGRGCGGGHARVSPRLAHPTSVGAAVVLMVWHFGGACAPSEPLAGPSADGDGRGDPGIPAADGDGETSRRPNVVFVFVDDLGIGDLGVYGGADIATPHIDSLAEDGIRFAQFYNAASVCTPSRASLLTGKLPARIDLGPDSVLFPSSTDGLRQDELTLAELFMEAGYATACVGKWHLGHLAEYHPNRHGFEYSWGIPYSHDLSAAENASYPELPLYENETLLEQPVDPTYLTERYTEVVLDRIRKAHDEGRPFFIYYPNNNPHVPLAVHPSFAERSARGPYGDVVEEIDWSVGQILDVLDELGIADDTIVLFASDNGAASFLGAEGGSNGILRGAKASVWEGGFRVPMIVRWPNAIRSGTVIHAPAVMFDWAPTFAAMLDSTLHPEPAWDGVDIMPLVTGRATRRQEGPFELLYEDRRTMSFSAFRQGSFKIVLGMTTKLYDLDNDPGESINLALAMRGRMQTLTNRMTDLQRTVAWP